MTTASALYQRDWGARRIAAGICLECRAPAADGSRRCDTHGAAHARIGRADVLAHLRPLVGRPMPAHSDIAQSLRSTRRNVAQHIYRLRVDGLLKIDRRRVIVAAARGNAPLERDCAGCVARADELAKALSEKDVLVRALAAARAELNATRRRAA